MSAEQGLERRKLEERCAAGLGEISLKSARFLQCGTNPDLERLCGIFDNALAEIGRVMLESDSDELNRAGVINEKLTEIKNRTSD